MEAPEQPGKLRQVAQRMGVMVELGNFDRCGALGQGGGECAQVIPLGPGSEDAAVQVSRSQSEVAPLVVAAVALVARDPRPSDARPDKAGGRRGATRDEDGTSLAVTTVMRTSRLIVAQRMTRELYAVEPDTSLATVARILEIHDISGVPVIDAAGHAVGVVSQTDLLDSLRPRSPPEGPSFFHKLRDGQVCATGTVDHTHDAIAGTVADVMSRSFLSIGPNATVVDAARSMLANGVHRLFVLDCGRIVGAITSTDCLSALVEALDSPRSDHAR